MSRNEQDAGIDLAGMELDDISKVAAQIFEHVSQYPREPRPSLVDAKNRQREALLGAVVERTGSWTEEERTVVAALFDVLWSVAAYERLVVDWELGHDQAVAGMAWVIGLVEEAVRDGRRPV
jgi:hypothetical protein